MKTRTTVAISICVILSVILFFLSTPYKPTSDPAENILTPYDGKVSTTINQSPQPEEKPQRPIERPNINFQNISRLQNHPQETNPETQKISEFLTDSLQKEARDEWSTTEEKNLLETSVNINKNSDFKSVQADAICGSSFCKLQIILDGNNNDNQTYAELFHKHYMAQGNIEGFAYLDEPNKVEFFVSRPGERLPVYTP